MNESNTEGEELRQTLEYLLRTRESLEKITPQDLAPGMQYRLTWSVPRHEFILNACKFIRRIIGERLHDAELALLTDTKLEENAADRDVLATLANAIRSFEPLFTPLRDGVDATDFASKIADDLIEIYWGDEPRFFSTPTRWQGMHKRPFRLAYLRRAALDWEKYLHAAQVSAFERQNIVAEAYRTRWDTIRKWKHSIEEQFDLISWPPARPDWVCDEYKRDREGILQRIANDGAAYWLEKSSAKVGKDS